MPIRGKGEQGIGTREIASKDGKNIDEKLDCAKGLAKLLFGCELFIQNKTHFMCCGCKPAC